LMPIGTAAQHMLPCTRLSFLCCFVPQHTGIAAQDFTVGVKRMWEVLPKTSYESYVWSLWELPEAPDGNTVVAGVQVGLPPVSRGLWPVQHGLCRHTVYSGLLDTPSCVPSVAASVLFKTTTACAHHTHMFFSECKRCTTHRTAAYRLTRAISQHALPQLPCGCAQSRRALGVF
jgi:hypothetical protein